MCGIAGYAGWDMAPEDAKATLVSMCGAIRHRGPNDEGHFIADGVGLGARRLSIIDVEGGAQPIGNEDGSIQVVFNGELYNHREVQSSLEQRGHRFGSYSDTEILVHLYEEHGSELVHHLRGMFAFAIWDARHRRLLLARDRVGIKPLYFWPTPDGIAFASELRSLLTLDRFDRSLDHRAILQYLAFGYVPDPLSIFRGVSKLPPGHLLEWGDGSAEVRQYWTPSRPERPIESEEAAIGELQGLLSDAVESRLESEVPLGAFLSGGIDSSTVVALMARHSAGPVRTFSIGFDDPRFNEAPHAAAVARELGTDHTELVLRPDADVLIEQVVSAFDEPFADSSALPTYLVSQLARQHVTVALSGDGGDELFGGYTRYANALQQREIPSHGLRSGLGALGRRLPRPTRGRNRILDLARTRRGRYATMVAQPLDPSEGGIVRPDLLEDAGPFEALLDPWFDRAGDRDFLTQLTLVDMMSYLPGDILTKVDRAAMANSIETRVPILDHAIVEFAVSLPPAMKLRGGEGKWILRRAIEGIVPPAVLQKPKQGFAVPLDDWFRGDLQHRVQGLLRRDSPLREWVDDDALQYSVGEHQSGRRDRSSLLWRLMVLDLWLAFLDRGALAKPSEEDAVRDFVVAAG